MNDNSGALSIDFLVGFTIFILAFIWVATMIPNLFIGLSTHTIDYDAVAYRTGVILVEDSGALSATATNLDPWETQTDNKSVARFGLAISKETPNVLDEQKVKRFFCSTMFIYPDDYRNKAIFGDYPYRFNISLKTVRDDKTLTVGDIIPQDHSYGYIRRDVKIKGLSNATINATPFPSVIFDERSTFNRYSIKIDSNELLFGNIRDPAYQIIPQNERIMINITNLTGSRNISEPNPTEVNLTRVQIYQRPWGPTSALSELPVVQFGNITYVDGNTTGTRGNVPVQLQKDKTQPSNVSLVFEPRTFSMISDTDAIYINLTFGIDPAQEYLNNTRSQAFNYTYTNSNVTAPALTDGVLEVAVW